MCDLKRGATTSLVELEYITHTAEESMTNDRVPSGLPYATVDAHMQQLDVVFLSRFLFEVLRYINLLLAMQPTPLQGQQIASKITDDTAGSQKADKVGFAKIGSGSRIRKGTCLS